MRIPAHFTSGAQQTNTILRHLMVEESGALWGALLSRDFQLR
jgi:hypothetical protein